MEKLRFIYACFFTWIATITYYLFGSFSWSSPPWWKHKLKLLGISIFITVCMTGYKWHSSVSKQNLVSVKITAPSPAEQDEATPQPLIFTFGTKNFNDLIATSVAPLEHIGQEVVKGIKMQPEKPGVWQWISDHQLAFFPSSDWLAGERYQIFLNHELFSHPIALAENHHQFAIEPLSIQIAELRFYQDPIQPQLQKVVATLACSVPVDCASLDQHVYLKDLLDVNGQTYPLTLTYDKQHRTAFVESLPITLTSLPRFVHLVVDKGIKAQKGQSKTELSVSQKLYIPDLDSAFQIYSIDTAILRDPQNRPEQILTVETSIGVSSSDLLNHLQLYTSPKKVSSETFALGTPMQLEALPEEHPFPTKHHFKFHASNPNDLHLVVKKGLKSSGGFILAHDYTAVIKAPDYPKELDFLYPGSLLALSGEKKLALSTRGLAAVKLSLHQLLENQVTHLISQTYGDFQNPKFRHPTFNQDSVAQLFTEIRQLDGSDPKEKQAIAIHLEDYLANSTNPLGLFLIKAEGWDPQEQKPLEIESSRLIMITDMDLIVKDNADGSRELFVHSITQGHPIEKAEVSLVGKNGLSLITEKTDVQGHVYFPATYTFKEGQAPAYYLVRYQKDLSFIPYQRADRTLNQSRFNTGGVSLESNKLSAYLFSDRGVYRPGEKIHLAGIIKNHFAGDSIPDLPLEILLIDPRGVTLLQQKIASPESGFFTFGYSLASTALTGQYRVKAYLGNEQKSEHLLGSTSLRVEEFLPDQLKMKGYFTSNGDSMLNRGWLSPYGLKAHFDLWNLFGKPASHHRIEAKMVLEPIVLHFPSYASYRFIDPLLDPDHSTKIYTEELNQAETDAAGHAILDLNLDRFSSAYQLTLLAEGFEGDSGRSVAGEISATVAPYDYLVGYKTDVDLNSIRQHSHQNVHFIALNSTLKAIPVNDLSLHFFKIEPVSTLVQKPDGTYHYQTVLQEIFLEESSFAIEEEGSSLELPTEEIGNYVLTVTDQNGLLVSKLNFSITVEGNYSFSQKAELEVKLNKKSYDPGETIELAIRAPYLGAGLITIERDKIYAFQWFKAETTDSLQTIVIPPDFQGNGYVNVLLVREWDSDAIFQTPLSHAVVPFSIHHQEQSLQITLDVPTLVQPGEKLPIQFSTDKPAKILLFAVDEGILQLSNYQTPSPLAHFFRKLALTVTTSQIADLILPKHSGRSMLSTTGGDGYQQLLAMHLNPFKRKSEPSVVFWSGLLESQKTPSTVYYQVPDYFNGSLRVMAVASGKNAVGSAKAHVDVQGDFIIQPSTPPVAAPDDLIVATVAIHNTLEKDSDVSPALLTIAASPHLEVLCPKQQTLQFASGEMRLEIPMKVSNQLGEAKVTFIVSQGDRISQREATLSIRPAMPYRVSVTSGSDRAQVKTVSSLRELYPEFRSLQAFASTNPLILIHGLQSYLESFPYGCTEQLTSRAFAQLILAKSPLPSDSEKSIKTFKETLQTLRERQTCCGGFSYWPGSSSPSKLATLYAIDYLMESKLEGYPVPLDLFNSGIRYLENHAIQEPDTLDDARNQAYAIYLLTRYGIVTTNLLVHLHLHLVEHYKNEWEKDLTCAYLAATYQLLHFNQEAERLISCYQQSRSTADLLDDFYTNQIREAHDLILLVRHFPERLKKIGNQKLEQLVEGMQNDPNNTLAAAATMRALLAYAQTIPASSDSNVRMSELTDETKEIHFYNPKKEAYFYQVTQSGFDQNYPHKPIKNGLEVFRSYADLNGKQLTHAELGQKVKVSIKARSLNQQWVNHVAIVDLIPGGFEIVPNSLQSNCDYVDIREDRLIFYCSLAPETTEFSYTLRATNKGKYRVPPLFAESMYRQLQAQSLAGEIEID